MLTMTDLSHFDENGASRMVIVGAKPSTPRMARAQGLIRMQRETLEKIRNQGIGKGNVLEVARLAGIMASKKTDQLIPLCHSLPLSGVTINFEFASADSLRVESRVETTAQTGVEMEALTAVSIAALTVYDMVKSVDRGIQISDIHLVEKKGGKSGHYLHPKSGS